MNEPPHIGLMVPRLYCHSEIRPCLIASYGTTFDLNVRESRTFDIDVFLRYSYDLLEQCINVPGDHDFFDRAHNFAGFDVMTTLYYP